MRTNARRRGALAALAGALIMFVWGGFSHLVLIKGIGFRPLPDEPAVTLALAGSLREEGLYFFPGVDLRGRPTAAEQAVWARNYATGPIGLVLYRPSGDTPVSTDKLGRQFLADLLAATIMAWVTTFVVASYWRRVLVITALGACAWLSVSTIYWTWYRFPDAFILAQGCDKISGWFLTGLCLARTVPRGNAAQIDHPRARG